jgi:signal transduction histidine kinase
VDVRVHLRPYARSVETLRLGWRDAAVPAVLLLLGAVELATLRTTGWIPSIGLETLAALALVFRRTHPLPAVPVMAVALMLIPLTGTQMDEAAAPIFFYVLGVYSLGRYLPLRGGLVTLVLTLALVLVDFGFDPSDNDITDAVFVLSLALPPYFFGRISRRLAEQSDLLARQSEQLRDQAVRDERDRIARELHDVVAHSVSAMVVQTAAAQDLVHTDPDRADQLLASVADTGRRALSETGRLLHLVRDEADELGLSPAPGLADVPDLVESFRSGGLAVEASLALPAEPVPGGVDVSAYRVVQEALTNALKHGAGPVRLSVDAAGDEVRIACSNAAGQKHANGSGLGLQGMAERVGLLGGTLHHGASGDRFDVDVTIPVGRP